MAARTKARKRALDLLFEAAVAGGTLEVGYQIGCGIDMSTSNGVSLTGTAGISPSIAMALLLPFTIGMDATTALVLLASVYVGAERAVARAPEELLP